MSALYYSTTFLGSSVVSSVPIFTAQGRHRGGPTSPFGFLIIAIQAHSERGGSNHGIPPSGSGRWHWKRNKLADGAIQMSASHFFYHFLEKNTLRSPGAPIVYRHGQTARRVRSMRRPCKPTFPNCALTVTYWAANARALLLLRQGQRWGHIMKVKNNYTADRWSSHYMKMLEVSG